MNHNTIGFRFYADVHSYLRKNYGKASKCVSPNCKKISTNYDWALIKGKKYDFRVENFMELCRSCHAIYDERFDSLKKRIQHRIGSKHTEETKRKMSDIAKKKGQRPPPMTETQREELRQKMKGNNFGFTKGNTPWNKGIKRPEITGDKHPRYGKKNSLKTRRLISQKLKGKTPWNKGVPNPRWLGKNNPIHKRIKQKTH